MGRKYTSTRLPNKCLNCQGCNRCNREGRLQTIIRITQDYCFQNQVAMLINEFALTISPLIMQALCDNSLNDITLKKIAQNRRDFFSSNRIDIDIFCKGLMKKIEQELRYGDMQSLFCSIIDYKQRMENGLCQGFRRASEDMLRSTLALYIEKECFCEARTSTGACDIIVPSERAIIETKLWKGKEYYYAGFPELNDYLQKSNYSEGYYVIFDDTKYPNEIIKENGEVFDIEFQGNLIHVVFVRMNTERPSKLYKQMKHNKKDEAQV